MPVDADDEAFCAEAADRLAGLPGVRAVALGGSRAAGTARPDSDWDFAVYYRGTDPRPGGAFDPTSLGALGWPGEIFPIGGWGGGVFNGGAWLRAGDRRVDVHYRDLDEVEHHLAEARAGRFGVERLMFHLAGVPTYVVVAELGVNRVLRGELPRPGYPGELRRRAFARWGNDARATLGYARSAHAAKGHLADTAGAIALAACQCAHGVLAAREEWVTNEKTLVDRAGLRGVDPILASLSPAPGQLVAAVDAAAALLGDALTGSGPGPEAGSRQSAPPAA
jgi:Nucleotidyltransferase domain